MVNDRSSELQPLYSQNKYPYPAHALNSRRAIHVMVLKNGTQQLELGIFSACRSPPGAGDGQWFYVTYNVQAAKWVSTPTPSWHLLSIYHRMPISSWHIILPFKQINASCNQTLHGSHLKKSQPNRTNAILYLETTLVTLHGPPSAQQNIALSQSYPMSRS
jgi:hypothetical protein